MNRRPIQFENLTDAQLNAQTLALLAEIGITGDAAQVEESFDVGECFPVIEPVYRALSDAQAVKPAREKR